MGDTLRRQAREAALKALYASEATGLPHDEVMLSIIAAAELPERHEEFAKKLFVAVREEIETLDATIGQLAHNWSVVRLAALDRNILRLAMVELKHMPDTPSKVVINEAIELAKLYSTADSSSFINGILDRFARELKPVIAKPSPSSTESV